MKAEYKAFRTLMLSRPIIAARKVYDSVREASGQPVPDNYFVLFPTVPSLDDDRYLKPQSPDSSARHRFDVRVVATSADGLLTLLDEALALVGGSVTVAGRSCSPVQLVPGVEEGADVDKATGLHFADLTFEFWSRRAA